jgi:two-component system CheB/CheR fusion protein
VAGKVAEKKLPTAAVEVLVSAPAPKPVKASALTGRKILVAEDSLDNQALLRVLFRSTGGEFTFAMNGAEALQLATAEKYDLIIMDIQMPVMDGFEAVLKLREKKWEGPILALSAHAHQAEIDRALQNGFNAYVTKPIDKRALWQSIDQLLGIGEV